MNNNITSFRVRDTVYYSVYTSQGRLALYTSDYMFAERIARAFRENPHCTEVVVAEVVKRAARRL